MPIKYKYIPFRIKLLDKLEFLILFFSFSLLPLFSDYNWISTMIILPGLAVILFLRNRALKLFFDSLFIRMNIVFLFAILSVFAASSLTDYLSEIKKLLGVIVTFLIGTYLLRRNINNIWLLYLILLSKFVIMICFTIQNGITSNLDTESGRLMSGDDVGINANAYGYFAFIALFAIGMIMNIIKRKFLFVLFVLVLILSMYINILAASRAGLMFSIFSSTFIYLSLTFKSWKNFLLKISLSSLILIFLIISAISKFENLFIVKRFVQFNETGEDSRVEILREGITLFVNNPLGVGAGHFPIYIHSAAPHNGILLIAANYGFFALVAYLSIFIYFLKDSIKLLKSHNLIIIRYGLLFFFYGILFLIYHFFYDMVLNLYIMFMFFLVSYHLQSIKKGYIPSFFKFKNNEYTFY